MSDTPVYGNYKSYYDNKRPGISDERLSLLPCGFFKDKTVLDIGCNEGWVSCEIAQQWGANSVKGIDIDENLINGAWRRRRVVWSQQVPSSSALSDESFFQRPAKPSKRAKISHSSTAVEGLNPSPSPFHFPLSLLHSYGPLPIPSAEVLGHDVTSIFPHNITFRTCDWLEYTDSDEKYDVILALSITKWVHLNHGDEGLIKFFRRIYDALPSGGKLVLEPQDWKGYTKAKRMHPRLKQNAARLRLRPEDFESELVNLGFSPAVKMGTIGEGGLRRPIDVYEKP